MYLAQRQKFSLNRSSLDAGAGGNGDGADKGWVLSCETAMSQVLIPWALDESGPLGLDSAKPTLFDER